MRIIHCADLHLDSKIDWLPSEKAKIRREEIIRSFERLCDYATKNNVDVVLIAGDMFDTSRVTIKTRNRVLRSIEMASNVDFLYLSGNHDDDNFISSCDFLPSNLKLFSEEWTSYSYNDVVITGAKLNSINALSIYDKLSLDKYKFNIVTLHGQIIGYKNSENAEVISIPRLKDKNIDYLALGHIHSSILGEIDLRGKYAYSGCLDGRGFDETGDKGFILINIEGKKAQYEFVSFSSRNLYEVEYFIDSKDNFLEFRDEIIEDLTKKYHFNSLIKIVIKGRHTLDFDMDIEGLLSRFNELFFFVKIYDKTELAYNIDDYKDNKSLLGEFVRAVHESDMDEQMKSQVIMCGINAIKGEEI